ncbi:MAG: exodeoxyribonuclease I [Neisseria sp.]|nr:exodeoxyribonuclease I [Neisseria sp.]
MSHDFSYFFYHYQTFGTSKNAKVAQFVGVRTDADFNIMDDAVSLYCQPTRDFLPSPNAVLHTGITPQFCQQNGLPEPLFAAEIVRHFSQPNTCIIGFNNIRLDDERTRHLLYRNLFDPYEYSYQNGNSRWDLLDVLRACHALRPAGMEWAYTADGTPSFALYDLARTNDIACEAENATSELFAMVALARLLKQAQPRLFAFFLQHRHKHTLKQLIDLEQNMPLIHVSGMFGSERHFCSVVAPLAWHAEQANTLIVCDLMADLSDLLTLSAEELRERLYTPKTELLAQGKQPLPLKGVHLNKSPILAEVKVLLPEDERRLNIDLDVCRQNWRLLRQATDLAEKVQQAFVREQVFTPDENVENQLYQGFYGSEDKYKLAVLRQAEPLSLDDLRLDFADERVAKLWQQYRAKHFFAHLTRKEQLQWQAKRRLRLEGELLAFEQEWQAAAERYQNDEEKLYLLKQLFDYVEYLLR